MTEGELMSVLRSSLYPGAKDESIKLVIDWCRVQNKDPMKRPVHIVPMNVKKSGSKDDYEWRDVLMPGIGDYRTDAARTGMYGGIDEAKFGPDITRKWGDVEVTFPEWCEVTVYRIIGHQRFPFSSGKIRWLETYATIRRDSKCPNAIWQKRPYGQLDKCAEAMALRRAFPEVGAQPTAEEMEGRVIDHDFDEVPQTQLAAPKRRAGPAEAKDVEAEGGPPRPNGGAVAASAAAIGMVRRKLEAAGLTEAELVSGIGADSGLDALSIDDVNKALKWINEKS
jgi:phage recombination protein Bet